MHANLRCFETDHGLAWFGGGMDLTPFYLCEDDAASFHRSIREVCDRHRVADYVVWKQQCDDYIHLPRRGEARGIGGIFYDHLVEDLDAVDAFKREFGSLMGDAYLPILERRFGTPFTSDEERWQLQRRGRCAEFNLAVDRGLRFGFETGARTESVLASLPPRVRWDCEMTPDPEPADATLVALSRRSRTWS